MASPKPAAGRENPELTVLVLLRRKTRAKKFVLVKNFGFGGGYRIQNDTNIQPLRHDKGSFLRKKIRCVCAIYSWTFLFGCLGGGTRFLKTSGLELEVSSCFFSLGFFLLDAEVFKVTSDEKSRLRAFSESQNVIFVLKIPLKPMSQEGDFFPCEDLGVKIRGDQGDYPGFHPWTLRWKGGKVLKHRCWKVRVATKSSTLFGSPIGVVNWFTSFLLKC